MMQTRGSIILQHQNLHMQIQKKNEKTVKKKLLMTIIMNDLKNSLGDFNCYVIMIKLGYKIQTQFKLILLHKIKNIKCVNTN